MSYTVRFNLGKGKRYKTWKITSPDGSVQYLDPNEYSLLLMDCKLINSKSTATKIFEGANKRICAYIECRDLITNFNKDITSLKVSKLGYNPRVKPYWTNTQGEDIDDTEYNNIITHKHEVYHVKV